jgi:hypothetical protein
MTDAGYTLLSACVVGKASDDYVFTRSSGKRVRDFRKNLDQSLRASRSVRIAVSRFAPNQQRATCAGLAFLKR